MLEPTQDLSDPFTKQYPVVLRPKEGGKGIEYTIYINAEITAPGDFNEVCDALDNASPEDIIYIKLNTPGGRLDSALMLRDSIKNSPADVMAVCSGTVASAGTMIALSCDALYAADHLEFMCHNYTGGAYGKGHELQAAQDFTGGHFREVMQAVYTDFLSKREIKHLVGGKDYYFSSKETLERWEKVMAKRAVVHDKAAQEKLAGQVEEARAFIASFDEAA